jgi:16S rRNA pseudouridine516 synthase
MRRMYRNVKIRIDKMLSNNGLGSRKQIKQDAKEGLIRINDVVVKDSSKIIDTDKDEVKYKNETVKYTPFIYLMMNKPQGVVSATEDNYDKTVIDLLKDEDKFYEPFPVGRLDKDTEGLLLITNDGKLTHDLLSPKKHVDKTYYAEVAEELIEDDVKAFAEGVILTNENYKTLPAKLVMLDDDGNTAPESSEGLYKCLVTIKEGKFHLVKRMFNAANNDVVYLKRISMGPLKLDESLKLGEYRHLT